MARPHKIEVAFHLKGIQRRDKDRFQMSRLSHFCVIDHMMCFIRNEMFFRFTVWMTVRFAVDAHGIL